MIDIATSHEVPGDGEELVVDEAGVEAEEAHEGEQVSELDQHLERVSFVLLDEVCVVDQVETCDEQKASVADVSEHDSEEEGEEGDGEQSGVDFSIARDPVGVDYFLEGGRELVEFEVGGGTEVELLAILDLVANALDVALVFLELVQTQFEQVFLLLRHPAVPVVIILVMFQHVHVQVQTLLLDQVQSHLFDVAPLDLVLLLRIHSQLLDYKSPRKFDAAVHLDLLFLDLVDLALKLLEVHRNVILHHVQTITDLLYLILQHLHLPISKCQHKNSLLFSQTKLYVQIIFIPFSTLFITSIRIYQCTTLARSKNHSLKSLHVLDTHHPEYKPNLFIFILKSNKYTR